MFRYVQDEVAATDRGAKMVNPNEEALKKAVATIGPISVAIDASSQEFMSYKSGVLNIPNYSYKELNHAVLVVGYGHCEETGLDYWLVKNSWGSKWGDNGYIKIARNMGNMCSIAMAAFYPIL